MKNYFLQEIIINDVLDIQEFSIPLSTEARQHLMITGKNGSGKTTLLIEINLLLNKFIQNGFAKLSKIRKNISSCERAIAHIFTVIETLEKEIVKLRTASQNMTDEQIKSAIASHQSNIANHKNDIKSFELAIVDHKNEIASFSKINLIFNNNDEVYSDIVSGEFILAYFKAKRHQSAVTPTTITKQAFAKVNSTEESLSKTFVQFMVNQYTQKVYAKDEGNIEEAQKIEAWFNRFENSLKELFDKPSLKLVYDRKKFNFHLVYDNRKFGFDGFSDGYASVLSIVTELILRMEAHEVSVYDMQGLVLIDELETHLHVDLQKKIFPFLTSFFPNIQFIVTTHSPFVLSSISNAVICDLENKMIVKDLTAYSYDALIESYFNSDKYSQEIKVKIARFDELLALQNRTEADKAEFYDLKNYLNSLPTFMADELAVEKAKPSGSYNQADVLQQLEQDFCNKCYICEQKAPTSINIEHFVPHERNQDLKFSWENLFYACGHCNNCKLHHFDNILNCTLASDQIEESIKCNINPFPKEKPYFDIIIPSPKADETKKLLEKVFNGEHTPNKTFESANLRDLLIKEINLFQRDLFNYFYDEDKDYALSRIKQHLSKSSAFTSFKRWIVRERYLDDFAYLLG